MGRLRDEVGQPTVVDRHAGRGEFAVFGACCLPETGGDERDRFHIHRAVEQHTGGHAVVVVVGETGLRVVVAGRSEVGVVQVAAPAKEVRGCVLLGRGARREPIEVVEMLRRAIGA